ncbi:RNA polymerase factor sigma-54 [Sulfuriflexus sp.]|uniref:RNA polymerase factor sigma-54 n=1 Tax=Sulfuriflexus sp. TaxID=2015443 RepID=UPI0028CF94E3|nr:RNA polymerase factor sigma-54 [Sulfuriflexus sp.]MDT8403486.1 RNA polymerase factor sigma-54 [Sulfuriflexus sp.]
MKQSIQLRLGQNLTMTPQLQQAIRLLQLSSLELSSEIQEALESNPMLEIAEGDSEEGPANPQNDSNGEKEKASAQENLATTDTDKAMQQTDIPDDLPVDTAWDDIYETGTYQSSGAANAEFSQREFEINSDDEQDLHDHLSWQMNMTPFSETDTTIATAIIDAVGEDGYLESSTEDLFESLQKDLPELELDEVEAVLRQVQNFDPPGVASRNLGECMLMQLRQLDPATPWREQAIHVVAEHLDLLAAHDYTQLMRRMKLAETDMQQVIALIRSLNPRPGSHLSSQRTEYIVPDVYVRKYKGVWRVELNPDVAPKLRINSLYASMIRRADNSEDNNFLKDNLQEARWLLKSLQSRNETLLKVATCIVEHQRGFLEHGEEAMKALVLHDVAEAVEMHESTISRVTTRKYMHTPRGIFELKYFFSSHVSTASGGECSSTAIRALIKKLVAAEEPKKPLSDNKIASLLEQQGINVARRTVAKYREAMSIPPSNERKRLM